MKILLTTLLVLLIIIIIGVLTFFSWLILTYVFKNIHHYIIKKELQKILNGSRTDDQFLCILYNTFELKEKK